VRLLLDTHSFLWFIEGSAQLSVGARAMIDDVSNEVFLSVASLWEIAIKVSIGKLSLHQPYMILIPAQLQLNRIQVLNISFAHTAALVALPFHHKDPFDRMLIAQSLVEGMPLVSADTALDAYSVTRLW
jgi:PIN domain nuclease of toxin-antitoxin system